MAKFTQEEFDKLKDALDKRDKTREHLNKAKQNVKLAQQTKMDLQNKRPAPTSNNDAKKKPKKKPKNDAAKKKPKEMPKNNNAKNESASKKEKNKKDKKDPAPKKKAPNIQIPSNAAAPNPDNTPTDSTDDAARHPRRERRTTDRCE